MPTKSVGEDTWTRCGQERCRSYGVAVAFDVAIGVAVAAAVAVPEARESKEGRREHKE
jgi:hypothetical protein